MPESYEEKSPMPKPRKNKKGDRRPNLPAVTLLRPRLDALFANPAWSQQAEEQRLAELAGLMAAAPATSALPILLKAVQAAPAPELDRVQHTAQQWVSQTERLAALTTLVQQALLDDADTDLALAWLDAAGVETAGIRPEVEHPFFAAYIGEDQFGSQGVFVLLWYANRMGSRVTGLNLLIDYNPPWEGSVKDVIVLPTRATDDAIRDFINLWEERLDLEMEPLHAAEAKTTIINLLLQNRAQNIRPHRDLLACRQQIADYILTLPDEPDTPPFSIDDFDALAELDQSAESVMHFEQTVGRRARTDDGQEIVYLAGRDF
jgi:hypothetical protein